MDEIKRKNPWLGLASYQEGETLYGRDNEKLELSQIVLNEQSTLFYGKSGIGKSSLLNAGVIPLARIRNYLPIYIRFSHDSADSQSYLLQIKEAIEQAIYPIALNENGSPIPLSEGQAAERKACLEKQIKQVVERKNPERESLYEYFHRHTFHTENGGRLKLLIIFDQFEEIFTLQDSASARDEFFSELADMINNVMPKDLQPEFNDLTPPSDATDEDNPFASFISTTISNQDDYVNDNEVHLVFTIREDFLSEFEYYSAAIPQLKQNRYGLRALDEEEASQIIQRPRHGLVSLAVTKLIIEKVTGRTDFELDGKPEIEVDSAVLSLYLNRLYHASDGKEITARLVEERGGEIIKDFYLSAIAEISEDSVIYLEENLLNGQGRRNNISVYDAKYSGKVSDKELDILCNKRKILRRFNYAGALRIEFIHDILCPIVNENRDRRELERHEEEMQQAIRQEKARTRKRTQLFLSIIFVMLALCATIWFWGFHPYNAYYAQFDRINGWPRGIGNELSVEQRSHTPLYYKLSRIGYFSRTTDIEVMSSNNVLPNQPRIHVVDGHEDLNTSDSKAQEFYIILSKVSNVHFAEGETGKIDKEVATDDEGNILYTINYSHLPNSNSAWAMFFTADGKSLQVSDRGVDRMKLSWYNDTVNVDNVNNGRSNYVRYYDANYICRPINGNVGGYSITYCEDGSINEYLLDTNGRTLDINSESPYNVIIHKTCNDTLFTHYAIAKDLEDQNFVTARNAEGYSKSASLGDMTWQFSPDNAEHTATQSITKDSRGNIIEVRIDGSAPSDVPSLIKQEYDAHGHLISVERLDNTGKAFTTTTDSIYRKTWTYDDNNRLTSEQHWNANETLVYSFNKFSSDNYLVVETISTMNNGMISTRIDSIYANNRITAYYNANHIPDIVNHSDGKHSILCHKVVTSTTADSYRISNFYTLVDGNIKPCPQKRNEYGEALSFFRKVEKFNADGTLHSYRLFDTDTTTIIKSMMYFYQNGEPVARAVMGIDGTPVRCHEWEEEGYAYYKIYTHFDIGQNLISITAVNEFEQRSTFYDQVRYLTITDRDYKGYNILYNGTNVPIPRSYYQEALEDDMDISDLKVPFIHILSRNSNLYKAGLRDGDRIISLGKWELGMSESSLSSEWNILRRTLGTITILRPTNNSFEQISLQISLTGNNLETYHTYALTKDEKQQLTQFISQHED